MTSVGNGDDSLEDLTQVDLPAGMSTASVIETDVYCFDVNGTIVDYRGILKPHELELADEINKSLDDCEAALMKAYELYHGDLQVFLESPVCKLLLHKRMAETVILGSVPNLFSWKNLRTNELELRASVKNLHGDRSLIMDSAAV